MWNNYRVQDILELIIKLNWESQQKETNPPAKLNINTNGDYVEISYGIYWCLAINAQEYPQLEDVEQAIIKMLERHSDWVENLNNQPEP